MAILLLTGVGAAFARPKKKEPSAQAILAGTVFRDDGRALRGAEVWVSALSGNTAEPAPPKRSPDRKKSGWNALSDARGEFVIRVPAGPARYTIGVKAEGFRPVEKQVSVSAEERLDFSFLLERQ